MHKKHILLISLCLLIILSSCTLPNKREMGAVAEAKSLSSIFKQVNPSVVVILTKEHGYSDLTHGTRITAAGLGSGVVISKDGSVLTAAHVVHAADKVAVRFLHGETVTAKIVGSAMQADIALLKLDYIPENLVAADLGDADQVDTGEEIFVVGAPYGIDHTLTVGHISGRRRHEAACDPFMPIEFLQTDAAINKGNSGGPMFSMDGKVIGIVSHILSQSGGSEGLGFAASINTARDLLVKRESFWIGLEAYLLSGPLAEALNVPQEAGLLIQRVADDSPAHRLGLRPGKIPIQIGDDKFLIGGDILLEVQGIPVSKDVEKTCKIRDRTAELSQGNRIELKILRAGKSVNLFTLK